MARPTKQGLDYFPLDVDFFQDLKIRKIIRTYGDSATAILICILCMIYKDNGYHIKWDEDTAFIISEILNSDEEKISLVVSKAIEVDFFNKEVFSKFSILTSRAIQKRFQLIVKNSKLKRSKIEHNLNLLGVNTEEMGKSSEETPITSEETPITSEESTQSKVKKSKEKKSKENLYSEVGNFDFNFLANKDIFNGDLEQEFLGWIFYLKEFGKKLTQQMIEIQYSNLMRNSNNNKEKAIELINRAISKGWSDIYVDKTDIDFDIKSIIGNSTNLEYVDFINYIEKYAVFLNRMNEPLTEGQFIRLVKLKGLKTLKTIIVNLHNEQVYYEKLTNTFLTINKFIERNEKK